MARHFVQPGWYAFRYISEGKRTAAYREVANEQQIQDTIDEWTGKGFFITGVDFIPDPTVVRVNGVPLSKLK